MQLIRPNEASYALRATGYPTRLSPLSSPQLGIDHAHPACKLVPVEAAPLLLLRRRHFVPGSRNAVVPAHQLGVRDTLTIRSIKRHAQIVRHSWIVAEEESSPKKQGQSERTRFSGALHRRADFGATVRRSRPRPASPPSQASVAQSLLLLRRIAKRVDRTASARWLKRLLKISCPSFVAEQEQELLAAVEGAERESCYQKGFRGQEEGPPRARCQSTPPTRQYLEEMNPDVLEGKSAQV